VLSESSPENLSTFIQIKGEKGMQDNYSYQTSQSKSEQSDSFQNLEEQKPVIASAITEMKFRSVMSEYEMEILTTLFPKCARTLAGVLRNRPQQFGDEL
jgi:hypothetical protein